MTIKNKRFSRDIIIVLAVLSIAIVTPIAFLASQARRNISEQYIFNASNQAIGQFRALAQSMEVTLGLMRDWSATGRITLKKDEGLTELFFPVFAQNPLLYGISLATIEGDSFYIHRQGDGFFSRKTAFGKKENNAIETDWSVAHVPSNPISTNSTFDPRTRAWFSPALVSPNIHWTEPYSFFSTENVGITASVSFLRKADKQPQVIAFDVLLDQTFDKIIKLAPSRNSRIMIFRHDKQLYIPGTKDHRPEFMTLNKVPDALIRKVHSNWTGENELANRVIKVFHEGAVWWCGFQPLKIDNPTTWVGVMIPETDILEQAGKRSFHLWIIGFMSLLVVVALTFWIVHRNRRPFEVAVQFDMNNPEASVHRLIAEGEHRSVEFKSTMRMNLHSKKPGKEIELAWMKGVAGFLNTDGGILLIGITDDGEITGLERDVFENEDKCRLHFKNLISKHIGADQSKHIRFILVKIDDKTVGVVRCARSEDPVFLKDGNKEHFYIRNGPASDELPVSQALNYIKHRK